MFTFAQRFSEADLRGTSNNCVGEQKSNYLLGRLNLLSYTGVRRALNLPIDFSLFSFIYYKKIWEKLTPKITPKLAILH